MTLPLSKLRDALNLSSTLSMLEGRKARLQLVSATDLRVVKKRDVFFNARENPTDAERLYLWVEKQIDDDITRVRAALQALGIDLTL